MFGVQTILWPTNDTFFVCRDSYFLLGERVFTSGKRQRYSVQRSVPLFVECEEGRMARFVAWCNLYRCLILIGIDRSIFFFSHGNETTHFFRHIAFRVPLVPLFNDLHIILF